MPTVELIYDGDCPNVAQARESLLRGFADAQLPPAWIEWERGSAASPPYARSFGSPTILVEGRDVAGAGESGDADCCRIYRDGGRPAAAPQPATVAAALRTHGLRERKNLKSTPAHTIEVFTAGCAACRETVDVVNRIAGPSAHVLVHDTHDPSVAQRAASLGVGSLPAAVVDGRLAD